MAATYCSNCGAQVHPGAKFCASCGSAITEPEAVSDDPPTEAAAASTDGPAEQPQVARAAPPKKGLNGKKIIFGILIWPLGAYWLARRFGQSRGRAIGAAFAGGVLLIIVIAASGGNNKSNTNASPPTQPPASPSTPPAVPTTTASKPKPKSKPKEQYELIVSQSSCQESPTTTSVNCSIGVKNRGDTAGQPTVYVLYHYTDGSETTDESDNGTCGKNDDIPPGQLGYVYFCHNYDPLKHDLLRAAATLKIDAKEWPYVRVASANDPNWPSG